METVDERRGKEAVRVDEDVVAGSEVAGEAIQMGE
jgi:hypothetical protein